MILVVHYKKIVCVCARARVRVRVCGSLVFQCGSLVFKFHYFPFKSLFVVQNIDIVSYADLILINKIRKQPF